eukprot:SAG22_NODE_10791_length_516_cov_0.613909_2_plen_71_part_00
MAALTVALALALGAGAATAAPPPRVISPPRWAWSTVGEMAFAHTGEPQVYSPAELQLLNKVCARPRAHAS